MEDTPILKKTFYTVAVMLAVWAAFVGTVSFVAVFATSRAVGSPSGGSEDVIEVPASHVSDTGSSPGAAPGGKKTSEQPNHVKRPVTGTQIRFPFDPLTA